MHTGRRSGPGGTGWQVKVAAPEADELAPDGSEVRLLARLNRASMARFELPVGVTTRAVEHQTIEEYWYVIGGTGQMWLNDGGQDNLVYLKAGVSLALAPGTRFQFRSLGDGPLEIVGVAVPGWPGDDEAILVDGYWPATREVG